MNSPNLLRVGDLLLRPKCLGFTHVGVWLGNGVVFHNAPERGEHVSTVEDFASGDVVSSKSTNAHPAIVLSRVGSRLTTPRAYDLFNNNCEHSANHVVSGKAFSAQLIIGAAIVIASVALLLIARKR